MPSLTYIPTIMLLALSIFLIIDHNYEIEAVKKVSNGYFRAPIFYPLTPNKYRLIPGTIMLAIALAIIPNIQPLKHSTNIYSSGIISRASVWDTDTSPRSRQPKLFPSELTYSKNITGLYFEFGCKGGAEVSGIAHILWNNSNGTKEIETVYRSGETAVSLSKPPGGFVEGKNIVVLIIDQDVVADVTFFIQ